MSGLLIDGPFVAVFPALVKHLGSIESAAILQHLHFRASASTDGRALISRQQISDETGINVATVTRRLKALIDEGYVEAERSSTWDSTLAYTVVAARLETRG